MGLSPLPPLFIGFVRSTTYYYWSVVSNANADAKHTRLPEEIIPAVGFFFIFVL